MSQAHIPIWPLIIITFCAALAVSLSSERVAAQQAAADSDSNSAGQSTDDTNGAASDAGDGETVSFDTDLPNAKDKQLPSVAELLHEPPVDWILLATGEVLEVKPIELRPNGLERLKQRIQENLKLSPPEPIKRPNETKAEFRERAEAELKAFREKRLDLQYLQVVLPDDVELPERWEAGTFRIDIEKYVRRIIHHEDLMLKRIDQLLDDGQLSTAFELLLVLDRRHPNWPGFDERRNRLLLLEARQEFENGRHEAALAYLEELHAESAGFAGLSEALGKVVGTLIETAVSADDFRRARHFLRRLDELEPQHPVGQHWQRKLETQAADSLRQAREAHNNGRHAEATVQVEAAARVWPRLAGLRSEYEKLYSRYQRLHVAVVPGGTPRLPWRTRSQRRWQRLTHTDLFEVDRFDDAAHYQTRVFEQWEPTDLGRRIEFTLRRSRAEWESQQVVTAASIMSALSARLDSGHAAYDERFASLVDSVRVRSPFEFVVQFDRVPVRPEPLFRFPVPASSPGRTDRVAVASQSPSSVPPSPSAGQGAESTNGERASFQASPSEQVSSQTSPVRTISWQERFGLTGSSGTRFHVVERQPNHVVFRRTVPEPSGRLRYHVGDVVEHAYSSYEEALQDLMRGKVSMLPDVPPWTVQRLREDERFFVRKYAVPKTHLLQFHPQSPVSTNATLRRALAFALGRKKILDEAILSEADSRQARVVSAPFPSTSQAYDLAVEPREQDLTLAISLSMVAGKQFGGTLPKLRLLCEPEPMVEAAADRLIQQWKRAGLTVERVSLTEQAGGVAADSDTEISPQQTGRGDAEQPAWDIAYRTVQMTEPALELWPLLTLERRANVEALRHLPDWLRQEVVVLERAGDFNSAVTQMQKLHRQLAVNVQLIPLWEVDRYLVVRKTVQGFRTSPVHPYQDIERWYAQPWYPTDPL